MDLLKLLKDYPNCRDDQKGEVTFFNLPVGIEEDFMREPLPVRAVHGIHSPQDPEVYSCLTLYLRGPIPADFLSILYSIIYRYTQFSGDERDWLRAE